MLKAEEDQVISMYSQLNPATPHDAAKAAEVERLSTVHEQLSVELATSRRGGGALAAPELQPAGLGGHPAGAGSSKAVSQFAAHHERIIQDIEQAVNDMETKLAASDPANGAVEGLAMPGPDAVPGSTAAQNPTGEQQAAAESSLPPNAP